MNRYPVVSSSITSVGYSASARVLDVEFRLGEVYRYFDVEPERFLALLDSPSKGQHVNGFIKRQYRFQRVTGVMPW